MQHCKGRRHCVFPSTAILQSPANVLPKMSNKDVLVNFKAEELILRHLLRRSTVLQNSWKLINYVEILLCYFVYITTNCEASETSVFQNQLVVYWMWCIWQLASDVCLVWRSNMKCLSWRWASTAHTLPSINVSHREANKTPALIFLGLSSLSSTYEHLGLSPHHPIKTDPIIIKG